MQCLVRVTVAVADTPVWPLNLAVKLPIFAWSRAATWLIEWVRLNVPPFDQTHYRSYWGRVTALHGMQTRSSDENSVCLSVCASVCQTRDPWQNGRKIGPDFYIIFERLSSLVFREEEWMVGGGDPFYVKFLVNRPSLERNSRFSTDIRS